VRGLRIDPERTEVRRLLRHAPLRGARVLEVGCGDGRLTRRIAGVVGSIVAIDPDEAAIARASRRVPAGLRGRIHFQVGSGEAMPFPAHSFDAVLFSWSL